MSTIKNYFICDLRGSQAGLQGGRGHLGWKHVAVREKHISSSDEDGALQPWESQRTDGWKQSGTSLDCRDTDLRKFRQQAAQPLLPKEIVRVAR